MSIRKKPIKKVTFRVNEMLVAIISIYILLVSMQMWLLFGTINKALDKEHIDFAWYSARFMGRTSPKQSLWKSDYGAFNSGIFATHILGRHDAHHAVFRSTRLVTLKRTREHYAFSRRSRFVSND